MPALNMGSPAVPAANPSTGLFVIFDPLSGPKGSPFDAKSYHPTTQLLVADPNNFSTGALCTGIGFGANHTIPPTAPQSIKDAGFADDYIPGETFPAGDLATDTRMLYIGGGRSALVNGTGAGGNGTPASEKVSVINYYNVQPIAGFGNGGSRDAGAGPAFTSFGAKMVTATGTVANGGAIETGFVNRSGVSMSTGQSAFGSSTTATAAPV